MAQPTPPFDPSKPDLEDSTNVSETHAKLASDSPAVAREKMLRENGTEAVPVWVFLLCAISLIVGGAVIGARGSFLGYDELVVDGYTTGEPPIAPPTAAVTEGPAMEVYMRSGKKTYSKCIGCHGANGAGQAGAIPPLAGSEWVTENTHLAATALIHGLSGPITVAGQSYNGNMAAQAANMSATELAGILTYIRNSFGNNTGDIVTPEMAQHAIDAAKNCTTSQMTAKELREKYDKMLPGKKISPETIVSFDDLQPVEAAAQ